MRNLPDELVQEILDELEDAGEQHAKTKARLRHLEEGRKILKAQLMKLGQVTMGLTAVQAREQFAYSYPTYVDHVAAMVLAVENEALMFYRWKRAEIRYEVWRTLSADSRAAKRP